jgi:group I intron endonuclease
MLCFPPCLFFITEGEEKIRETKAKLGSNNPLYGKLHSESTKLLMSQSKKGKNLSIKTKALISMKNGKPVYLYELNSQNNLSLIRSFFSCREAARYLDISKSTGLNYAGSGKLFRNQYKFSYALLDL